MQMTTTMAAATFQSNIKLPVCQSQNKKKNTLKAIYHQNYITAIDFSRNYKKGIIKQMHDISFWKQCKVT